MQAFEHGTSLVNVSTDSAAVKMTFFLLILLLDGKQTALIAAAQNGHAVVVKLLLKNGADINSKSPNSTTIFFIYLCFLFTNCSPFLVLRWLDGHPCRHLQRKVRGHQQVLIESGANLALEQKDGKTPLDLAVAEGKEDSVVLLKAVDAPSSSS